MERKAFQKLGTRLTPHRQLAFCRYPCIIPHLWSVCLTHRESPMVVAATVPSPGWARTAPLQPVVFVLLSAAARRSASSSLAFPLPFWLSACSALSPSHLPFLPPVASAPPLPLFAVSRPFPSSLSLSLSSFSASLDCPCCGFYMLYFRKVLGRFHGRRAAR